jgi:hypothetical protein
MVPLPFFSKLEEKVNDARDTAGIRPFSWPPFIGGLVAIFLFYVLFPHATVLGIQTALFLAPLWLTVLIITSAWHLYVILIRSEFIAKQQYVLLEIKPPRNLMKTPLAMEAVFSSIHYTKGESNWYQKKVQGQVRPYWSIELVSFGGQVHFYIWTRTNFRKLIENAFYAQYPGVQIVEAPDYTRLISAQPGEWGVWGCDYKHTASDVIPIKTYVDYGLDQTMLKEDQQIDPFAHITEFLGSMKKGENFWLQIIFRIHAGEKYGQTLPNGKPYTWRDLALEEVDKIRQATVKITKYRDVFTGEMRETEGFPNPTKGQAEKIASIERNVSKLAFDVGMRGIYIADPSVFDPVNITGMIALWKPFHSETMNGIKATHFGMEFSDYPWEFGNERRKDVFRRHIVQAYRRRQYFHDPFKMPDPMVMSTEELATVFHIPSASVATPSLTRISSATSEAPPNLPT